MPPIISSINFVLRVPQDGSKKGISVYTIINLSTNTFNKPFLDYNVNCFIIQRRIL